MPLHFLEAYPESVELIELLEVFLSGTVKERLSDFLKPTFFCLYIVINVMHKPCEV